MVVGVGCEIDTVSQQDYCKRKQSISLKLGVIGPINGKNRSSPWH